MSPATGTRVSQLIHKCAYDSVKIAPASARANKAVRVPLTSEHLRDPFVVA